MSFWRALSEAWRRLRESHPEAAHVLAGDANLPGMWEPMQLSPRPRNQVEHFFCAQLLEDMTIANSFQGPPAATRERGNVLDLILLGAGL